MLSPTRIAKLLTFGLWNITHIPTDTWGDAPSIRQMLRAMPKAALPDSMQKNLRFHKGYNGVFIGREQLLDDLVQMFSGTELERATTDITKELPFGALVTNAPGVGKSALVTKLAEVLRAKSYGSVCLSAAP